jgi:hypothetical protein
MGKLDILLIAIRVKKNPVFVFEISLLRECSLSRREGSSKYKLSACLSICTILIGQKNNVRMNGIILPKTLQNVIERGESESEVDFNQLIILRL